jgi:hypothetical protein
MILKRRPPKKRPRYEQDDDFDISDGKNGDADFLPRRRRYVLIYLFKYYFLQ